MAKNKKKKTQLSSEGKTELAKAIAEKSQTFAKTYANFENKISRFFRWLSSWLDKLLFNQKHGKVVALILAIIFYILMNTGQNIFDNYQYSRDLGQQKVSPIVSNQAYEVTGLPESVDVMVNGDLSDIKNVKQQNNFRVVANLTDLTEGTHSVKLEVESAPTRVKVILNPSTAVVTIKKKTIRRFSLGYDYVNRSQMDSIYDLGEPELEQGEVYVRASTETLDNIAYVKALIKVEKSDTSDFTRMATIAAYDANGDRLKNVDIIPGTMKAKVKVTKPSKKVPINIVPTGVIPNNKAIESYTLDHNYVTLYAKQSILDDINEYSITIPVARLTNDREFPMPVILLNGVSKTDIDVVQIKVKLAPMKEKALYDIPIRFKNAPENFVFTFAEGSSSTTAVTLKGAQKVIDAIKRDDVSVFVDIGKIDKAGTYEFPLIVEGKNKLVTYELKNATVKIECKTK